MNKFLTKLSVLTLIISWTLMGSFATKAQAQYQTAVWSLSASNTVTNLLVGAGWNIRRVTLLGNAGSGIVGYFYDYNTNQANAFSSLTYSNTTAFSNLTTVAWTNTVIFTNSLGRTDTNQYVGVSNAWTYVAAATASNAPVIGALGVVAGTPYTVDVNWNITRGLTFRGTNNANGTTIIVEYQ